MQVKQIFHWQTPGRSTAEMPTSGDLKSEDSLLFTPPHHPRNFNIHPPPLQKIDLAPNGNDLGHYMKSYMNYILSKVTIIILMPEIIFVRWLPYPFKCPALNSSCCVNKKNSSFLFQVPITTLVWLHRKWRTPLDSFCQLLMEASLPELDSSPLPGTCETIINYL